MDSHKSMLAGTGIASLPCSAWCSQSHTQGRACASVCKVRALRLLFAWGYPCAQHWEQSFISELLLPPSLPSDASQAASCFLITDHTFKATGILTLTWPVFSRRSDLRAFLCQPRYKSHVCAGVLSKLQATAHRPHLHISSEPPLSSHCTAHSPTTCGQQTPPHPASHSCPITTTALSCTNQTQTLRGKGALGYIHRSFVLMLFLTVS